MQILRSTRSFAVAAAVVLSIATADVAGAMPLAGSLPAETAAIQVNGAVLDESLGAPKIEKIYWCGRWSCHRGWGYHRWGWHPWGYHRWGYHRWGWHRGWHKNQRWPG